MASATRITCKGPNGKEKILNVQVANTTAPVGSALAGSANTSASSATASSAANAAKTAAGGAGAAVQLFEMDTTWWERQGLLQAFAQ